MDAPNLHINLLDDVIRALDSHEELEALCGYTRVVEGALHDRLVTEGAPICTECQERMDQQLRHLGYPTRRVRPMTEAQLRQEYQQRVLGYTISFSYNNWSEPRGSGTQRHDFPLAG